MASTFILILLIAATAFNSVESASCPSGAKLYNSKCYAALGMDMTRDNALAYCQKTYGWYARLTTPLTYAENNFVTEQVQLHANWHTWLEFVADGTYIVGDDGRPPAYTNFAVGEPFSTNKGYCITIGMNGYWYAQPCEDSHSALCEFDLYPLTTLKPVTAPSPNGFPSCVQKYLNFVPCQAGWEYYPPTCSCFRIISNTTYYNAMNTCRSMGGTLASVHNSGEAAFINRLGVQANSYWVSTASARDNIIIGLTYNSDRGYFQWDDSTVFDYAQGFAPGEPADHKSQGQIILSNPLGYATYIRMGDCSYQTCRYAACKRYVY
uniref:C-type lectin domain-containing protein n=1 Tax=Caenorhabditis japonica TaxID=281687 RepID=A0A8R1DJA9_CAEJA